MKDVVTKFLLLLMAVTYFFLAYQAEPITAGFGYFFGVLLGIAFFVSFGKGNPKE